MTEKIILLTLLFENKKKLYLTVTEVRLIAVFTASVIQLEIILFVAPCQFFLLSPSPPSSTQP